MSKIKIEIDRGNGWQTRQEGEADITAEALIQKLTSYAIQYPHRAFIDGVLIATAERPFGRRGKARIVRA